MIQTFPDNAAAAGNSESPSPVSAGQSGLKFERVFSNPEQSPYDEIEWEKRSVEITDETGEAVFQQNDVEVPRKWSALASKIAVSKYLYGDAEKGNDPGKNGRESSIRVIEHSDADSTRAGPSARHPCTALSTVRSFRSASGSGPSTVSQPSSKWRRGLMCGNSALRSIRVNHRGPSKAS